MNQQLLFPIIMGAFFLFAIYRRVRRNIGRQSVMPRAMQFRVGIFVLLAFLFAFGAMRDVTLLGALLAGIAGGVALGGLGLRHTKFEQTEQGSFYTPHTYIGLAVSLLLVGRIVYRLAVAAPAMSGAHGDAQALNSLQQSPLTLAIFGVLIGYYICYYIGVLRVSRRGTSSPA